MNEDYVLLAGEHPQLGIKTVLVEKDVYEDDPSPEDYFLTGFENIRKVGEVELSGDTDYLDPIYESA